MHGDPSGVTYMSARQNLGEPPVVEERRWDRYGREIVCDGEGRSSAVGIGEGMQRRRVKEITEKGE